MRLPIYLDCNATTPVDARVLDAMLPHFTETFGNPSSGHRFGADARAAVERSRASIARCLNAETPAEIVFTSGATESDNLAIKGVAAALRDRGDHLVTVATEHPAVLDACASLERRGFRVTRLGVGRDGLLDLGALADALTTQTILVSVMAANNEIGVLQDMAAIGRLCRERGILFHSDATQAVGKVPFDVRALGVDLASFSAHKIYGPKGAGGLYVRRGVTLRAQQDGGGHEGGRRSGTLNVPGIVGLAEALALCLEEMEEEARRLMHLRDRLKERIRGALDGVRVNGHETQRLPGHLHITLEGVDGDRLMMELQGIAVSSSAACHSGGTSHVLAALHGAAAGNGASLRFGIGRYNTADEIDYAADEVVAAARRLRG